jgi:hypothetical protein
MGMVDNNICKLRYLNITKDITKTHTKHVKINFIKYEHNLLEYPAENNTFRTINKEIKQNTKINDFIEQNEDKIKEIINSNNKQKEHLEELRNKIAIGNRIENAIKDRTIKLTDKFMELEVGLIIYIYAFKYIDTKYGKSILMLYSKENVATATTEYRTIWSTSNIYKCLDARKEQLKQMDTGIYGTKEDKPILILKKNGSYFNQSRNKCASVEIVSFRKNVTEDTIEGIEELKDLQLKEISNCIKIKDVDYIDKLITKEGEVIEIIGKRIVGKGLILEIKYNNNTKHVLAN